ncbi:MAG TPA: nucleotidyltransferase domain-containing protein, partial [Rhodothermales bacterium]|nr:nucleotidyltransferase domain-containing protein [Rhodothermales bacterium]
MAPSPDPARKTSPSESLLDAGKIRNAVSDILSKSLPSLVAVYLFGSHATGCANQESDVDLAFLSEQEVTSAARFVLQEQLAQALHTDVDLVDLTSASTVMRAQVLETAMILFESDQDARQAFEVFVLSSYALLNEERSSILNDIYE